MTEQEFTIDARDDYSAVLREELLREVGELAKNLLGLRTIRLGLRATEVLNLKSDLTLTTLRLHVKLASANLRMSTCVRTSEELSTTTNSICLCDRCNGAFHANCLNINIQLREADQFSMSLVSYAGYTNCGIHEQYRHLGYRNYNEALSESLR
jgi:hypothetical protein